MYFTRAMFWIGPEIVNKRQHTFIQLASMCVIMCSRFVQVSVAVVKQNDDPQSYFCPGGPLREHVRKKHTNTLSNMNTILSDIPRRTQFHSLRYPSKQSIRLVIPTTALRLHHCTSGPLLL